MAAAAHAAPGCLHAQVLHLTQSTTRAATAATMLVRDTRRLQMASWPRAKRQQRAHARRSSKALQSNSLELCVAARWLRHLAAVAIGAMGQVYAQKVTEKCRGWLARGAHVPQRAEHGSSGGAMRKGHESAGECWAGRAVCDGNWRRASGRDEGKTLDGVRAAAPEHDDACKGPVRQPRCPRGDNARLQLGLHARVTLICAALRAYALPSPQRLQRSCRHRTVPQ